MKISFKEGYAYAKQSDLNPTPNLTNTLNAKNMRKGIITKNKTYTLVNLGYAYLLIMGNKTYQVYSQEDIDNIINRV